MGANDVCLFELAALNQYFFISGLAACFKSILLLCRNGKHCSLWLFGISKLLGHTLMASVSQITFSSATCLFRPRKSSIKYMFFWFCGPLWWLILLYKNNIRRLAWPSWECPKLHEPSPTAPFFKIACHQMHVFSGPLCSSIIYPFFLLLLFTSFGYFTHIENHNLCS